MSIIFKRFASTRSISEATRSIAGNLLIKSQPNPTHHSQLLDSNQLQRLSLTLNRPELYPNIAIDQAPPKDGTPLPPGYHLAYFTPAVLPLDLGPDGTDLAFSPEKPFTRRMWAGGELQWSRDNLLRVGDVVTEITKLLSAEPKITRTGDEMIVVGVEKTFKNATGVALVDKRDWVFKKGLLEPLHNGRDPPIPDSQLPEPLTSDIKARDFCQSAVDLFRFSALTFNAHKIHYSPPWCREVEGHREIVVHGPLNLINMLDFWRDSRKQDVHAEDTDVELVPRRIRYRATAPFYVNEMYRAILDEGEDGVAHVRLWGNDGMGGVRVGMMGDITGFQSEVSMNHVGV